MTQSNMLRSKWNPPMVSMHDPFRPPADDPDPVVPPPPALIPAPAIAAAVVLGALVLRIVALDTIPPGLWFDEALNGRDAWRAAAHGEWHLLYPDVFPREPMFVTLLALALKVGGRTVESLRIAPVLIGTLTPLVLYLALRRELGRTTALAAAAVLAGMRWHLLLSRLVFRTIVLPLWMALLVWAVLACRRRPSVGRAAAVGALIGGGFYTYLAWYFMLPLVAGLASWLAWSLRREYGRLIAVMGGVALLTAAPILLHYAIHPEHLLARPGAVSVVGETGVDWSEIAENAVETLLMLHWRGDHVAVQNVPHAPALDPAQGVFFLWGLLLCVRGIARRRAVAAILLGWLVCGILPTVLTQTDSPNFLRTLVAAPAVAAIVAIGLVDAARRASRRLPPALVMATAVLFLAASAVGSAWQVRQWSHLPEVHARYQSDIVQLGRELAKLDTGRVAVFAIGLPLADSLPLRFVAGEEAAGAVIVCDTVEAFGAPWPPVVEAAGRPRPEARLLVVLPVVGVDAWMRATFPDATRLEFAPAPAGARLIGGVWMIPEAAFDAGEP